MQAFYITIQSLQQSLMQEIWHYFVPSEISWFFSLACLGVVQKNPLGFNIAAGQLLFPGCSLVMPCHCGVSLLHLAILHSCWCVFKKAKWPNTDLPPSLCTKPPQTTEAADKNASIDPQLLSSIRTWMISRFLSCPPQNLDVPSKLL